MPNGWALRCRRPSCLQQNNNIGRTFPCPLATLAHTLLSPPRASLVMFNFFERLANLRAEPSADAEPSEPIVIDDDDELASDGAVVAEASLPPEDDAGTIAPFGQFADIAAMVPTHRVAEKRKQTEKARAVLAAKRAKAQAEAAMSANALVSFGGAGAAATAVRQLLGPTGVAEIAKTKIDPETGCVLLTEPRAVAMQCLAMCPRLRGRNTVTAKRMQDRSACLVAHAVLELQTAGFREMVRTSQRLAPTLAQPGESNVLFMQFMFDEAQQQMRSMLNGFGKFSAAKTQQPLKLTEMPVSNSVMVTLGKMFVDQLRLGDATSRTEPWVAPLMFLARGGADSLLEALLRNFPVDMKVDEPLRSEASAFGFVCLFFAIDSAGANLSAMAWLQDRLMRHAPANVALHYEPCAAHQTHIVKTRCIDIAGLAGTLYSSSKLLRINSSLNGIRDSIHDILDSRLDIIFAPGPETIDDHQFMAMCVSIFGCDGDLTQLYTTNPDGNRVPRPLLADLQAVCRRLDYDWDQKRWKYFAWSFEEHRDASLARRPLPQVSRPNAVSDAAALLQNALFGQAWPIAALSRWTHVVQGMKRMMLGVALGGILVSAFARLATTMRINETEIEEGLQAAARDGSETDRWHRHCSRVLRVSRYWSDAERSWQACVVLLTVVPVDQMCYAIMGRERSPANLSDMVDPTGSLVARTQQLMLRLLRTWRGNVVWELLGRLGAADWSHTTEIRQFARKQLVQLCCGVFRRLVVRLSGFPYRLQWLISPATDDEAKLQMATEFFSLPGHCMSPAARRIRSYFQCAETLLGPAGSHFVSSMERALAFSTHRVEIEHRICRDDIQTVSKGSAHSHASHRAVVRHNNAAFIEKGNTDVTNLTLAQGRRRKHSGSAARLLGTVGAPEVVADVAAAVDMTLVAPPAPGASIEASAERRLDINSLGGGNPQMMFVNHKLQVEKATRSNTQNVSRADIRLRKQALRQEYDNSPDVQARWRRLFNIVQQRRKRAASQPAPAQSAVVVAEPVWGGAGVVDNRLPVPAGALIDFFRRKYGSMEALDKASTDHSPFTVAAHEAEPLVKDVLRNWGSDFGCAGRPLNVCTDSMAPEHQRPFANLHAGLSRFVDGIKRTANSVTHWLCFSGTSFGADSEVHMFVLLGEACFSPKYQVFVSCEIEPATGEDAAIDLVDSLPEFPFTVRLRHGPSRLTCSGLPASEALYDLCYQTSAELCKVFAQTGVGWVVRRLVVQEPTGDVSLMAVTATGWEGEPVELKVSDARTPRVPDCVSAFLQCASGNDRHERARRPAPKFCLGLSAARNADLAIGARVAETLLPDDGAPPPIEGDFGEEFGDNVPEIMHDMFEDLARDAHEVLSGIVVGHGGGPAEDSDGGEEKEGDSPTNLDEIVQAACDAADEPPSPGSPAVASSSGEPPARHQLPNPERREEKQPIADISVEVSERGYVTRTLPGEGPKVIGRFTTFGRNLSARCSVHKNCTWIATVARANREQMVRWIAQARAIPYSAPEAEHAAARREHQASQSAM